MVVRKFLLLLLKDGFHCFYPLFWGTKHPPRLVSWVWGCLIPKNCGTWMSRDGSDRITGERINGLVITDPYKWGMNWGEITILTFCQLPTGHPSTPLYTKCRLPHYFRIQVILQSLVFSKNFPTYPWNIHQTPNQQFMKDFFLFGGLGKPGVCSRGMLGFP